MENILETLKKYYGYSSFRVGQRRVIESVLNNEDVVAIMPTGAGKSICFQLPSVLFDGLTIVISPLISLMKDQVDSMDQIGIKATYINSTLSNDEINERIIDISSGEYKLLYIAPERLQSSYFQSVLKNTKISFVAVDEAHCVSQWAHDFRPSYMEIINFIRNIKEKPVIGAYTATATDKVKNDIINLLGLDNPKVYLTGFDRENLFFSVYKGVNKNNFILSYLEKNIGETGIIYTSTRKNAENLYNILLKEGVKVGVYHAGLSDKEREKTQNSFAYDKIDVVVATNAFGMGIDKSNVRFVIHNNMPKNMEAYYQEAGRAGRDGLKSECILLFEPRDTQIQAYFIEENNLSPERKENEYEKLRAMVDYCYTSQCLRKYILEYFGDYSNDNGCNMCSNCLDEKELTDITLEAKKIFSCIYRMNQRFGSGMVADVLKGSKNKKVLQFKLNDLSTYGIMDSYRKKDIVDIINKLSADSYLSLTNDGYPVLKLTNKAIKVLKKDEKVFIKAINIKRVIEVDNGLFHKLRELRGNIAIRDNVPPYIVFSDASLKEMSIYMPIVKEQFLGIKGVGILKYDKYGEDFLEVINEYINENNIDVSTIKKGDGTSSFLDDDSNSNNRNAGKSDTEKSYIVTYDMFMEGKSIKEISKLRDYAKQTIENHIVRCFKEGYQLNLKEIIPEEYYDLILKVLNEIETDKLKPIKDALPDDVEYFWINLLKNAR